MVKTVIMAGGKGSRIASIFPNIPKPMIKIDDKPILEHEITCLKLQGFTDLIITVSHLSSIIMEYFGDGKKFGVNIDYYVEERPLGNAGALFKLQEKLTEDFLLLNADVIFNVDFQRMLKFHREHDSLVTLLTHPNSHPYDSSIISTAEDNSVKNWFTKEERKPLFYKNRVNSGVHIINKKILDMIEINPDDIGKTMKVDLDRQVLKPLVKTGRLYCYDSPEYVRDMGTPERFYKVEKDLLSGIVRTRNFLNKQKAIFLDRDGTINKYIGFLTKIEQFELINGVSEAIRLINNSAYLCVVITNQPVVARGEVTVTQLKEIHNKMETLLGVEGCYIDALYYCPHHPDKGYMGEIPELKIVCDCRKPKPGMLFKAAIDLNIDLHQSYVVGDSEVDIIAGKNAGCKTVLLGKQDFGQDITVGSLLEFCKLLLK